MSFVNYRAKISDHVADYPFSLPMFGIVCNNWLTLNFGCKWRLVPNSDVRRLSRCLDVRHLVRRSNIRCLGRCSNIKRLVQRSNIRHLGVGLDIRRGWPHMLEILRTWLDWFAHLIGLAGLVCPLRLTLWKKENFWYQTKLILVQTEWSQMDYMFALVGQRVLSLGRICGGKPPSKVIHRIQIDRATSTWRIVWRTLAVLSITTTSGTSLVHRHVNGVLSTLTNGSIKNIAEFTLFLEAAIANTNSVASLHPRPHFCMTCMVHLPSSWCTFPVFLWFYML